MRKSIIGYLALALTISLALFGCSGGSQQSQQADPAPAKSKVPAAVQTRATPSPTGDPYEATLTGRLSRKEYTTAQTFAAWSAVTYELNFSPPVEITYRAPFDDQPKRDTFTRLVVFQMEQYEDNADKNLGSITDPTWQKHVGQTVTVRGRVINTGNNHTIGKATMQNATIVSAGGGQTTSTSVAPAVNLNNPDEYYNLNLFLSNFAEWDNFWQRGAYDSSRHDMKKIVDWAFWHYVLNNNTLVTEETELPGATNGYRQGEYGTTGGSWFGRHTDTAGVENAIKRYLGFDYDLSGRWIGTYAERDGKIYDSAMRGSASPRGYVVLCSSVDGLSSNEIGVHFTVCLVSYDIVQDKSWYGKSIGQALADLAMQGKPISNPNTYSGYAKVWVSGTGSDRTFTLDTFEIYR